MTQRFRCTRFRPAAYRGRIESLQNAGFFVPKLPAIPRSGSLQPARNARGSCVIRSLLIRRVRPCSLLRGLLRDAAFLVSLLDVLGLALLLGAIARFVPRGLLTSGVGR